MKILATGIAVCLLSIMATCQTTHQAVLNWAASSQSGVTYNVLRGSAPGGAKTTIKTGLSALTFTDAGLTANTQYCYQVTASATGQNDSAPSNEVCGTTGKDTTAAPGVLTITIQ